MGGLFQLFWGMGKDFHDWATTQFLTSYGWPEDCHGTHWWVCHLDANVLQ